MCVIVCTGYAADSSMVRSLPAGIRVVKKPCSSDDFMRAIQATMVSDNP
jgi:ActR/RegA family two-component response regulator